VTEREDHLGAWERQEKATARADPVLGAPQNQALAKAGKLG